MNKIKYLLIMVSLSLGAFASSHQVSKNLNLNEQATAAYFSFGDLVNTVVSGVEDVTNAAYNFFRETALPKIKIAVAIAQAIVGKKSSDVGAADAQNLNNALGDATAVGAQTAGLFPLPLPVRPTLTLPTDNEVPYAVNLAQSISSYVNQVLNPPVPPATQATTNRILTLQSANPITWTDDDIYFLMTATMDVVNGACSGVCAQAGAALNTVVQRNMNDFNARIIQWQQAQAGYLTEFFAEGLYLTQVFFTLYSSLKPADLATLQQAVTNQSTMLSKVVIPSS